MIDGLNITLPIWQKNGNTVTRFHNLELKKPIVDRVVMSLSDKITGDVYHIDSDLEFTMKEFVTYNDVRYYLVNPPTVVKEGLVKDNSDLKGMTKYSLEFYHPMYMLGNFPFNDVAVSYDEMRFKSQDKTFGWIGKPADFVAKLNKNLENTEWVVVLSSMFPQDKVDELSGVLTFDKNTIADALKIGFETWNVPYVVDKLNAGEYFFTDANHNNVDYYSQAGGRKRFVVLFGLPSNEIYEHDGDTEPYVLKFGQGVGLKNNSRTPRNNKIVTRISGYGSENNIPYGYPQIRWYGDPTATCTIGDTVGPVHNVEINGVVREWAMSYPIYEGIVGGEYVQLIKHPFTRTHLMPTVYVESVFNKISQFNADGTQNTNYDPDLEIIDYYDAVENEDGYDYGNLINPSSPSYEIHEFGDIKPELGAAEILGATPINSSLEDVEDWDDSMDDDGNYLQSYFRIHLPQLEFDIYACAAITEEMQINMRSGACIGCTFTVQVDWDDYKKNFYTTDGDFEPQGTQRDFERYPDSRQAEGIWLVVQKDLNTFGTLMPNIYQNPAAGDAFVVLGISLPQEYVTDGQERLDDAMKSYMLENNVYYFDYPLKFDEFFLRKNQYILNQIRPNSIIRFEYNGQEMELFVKQLTIKYGDSVLPQYDITLTDNVDVVLNSIGQVADDVQHLGSLLALLRQSYSKSVWVELARKLSKAYDDSASGLITFLQGLVSRGNADFTDASGFQSGWIGNGARIDNQGNAEFESVKVRGSMTASELVFNLINAEEGESIRSIGHGIIESVDYVDGSTTGSATLKLEGKEYPTIATNDICRGMYNTVNTNYNVTSGEDHNGFRKQLGFFSSYFTITNVTRSTNQATGEVSCSFNFTLQTGTGVVNYPPCAGMKFVCYGNTTNTDRQSCMYISAVGQSPRVLFLTGVNQYKIQPENIKIALCNVNGVRVWERVTDEEAAGISDSSAKRQVTKNDETYWIALKTLSGDAGFYCEDNIYLGGIIDQFKAAAMDAINSQISNLGQAQVTANYDSFPVDCASNGNVIENKTLSIIANLNFGNHPCVITSATATYNGNSLTATISQNGSSVAFGDIQFSVGDNLISSVVSISLTGTYDGNSYTASKTISVIANRQGNDGNSNDGVSAPYVVVNPDSIIVDCDENGYIRATKSVTVKATMFVGSDPVAPSQPTLVWAGSNTNYTPTVISGSINYLTQEMSWVVRFAANTSTPLSSAYFTLSMTNSGMTVTRTISAIANWKGATGDSGRGIASIDTYYLRTTLFNGVTVNTSGWNDEYVEPTEELPYLWRYTKYTYENPASIVNSDVELVAVYQSNANPNLLQDTEFISGQIDGWNEMGAASGDYTASFNIVTNALDGHNSYRGSVSRNYSDDGITLLKQVVYNKGYVEKLLPNTWYTLSFYAKAYQGQETFLDIELPAIDLNENIYVNGIATSADSNGIYTINNMDSTWVRYVITFKTITTLPSSFPCYCWWGFLEDGVYDCDPEVCMPKLEKGKIATPYTPMNNIIDPIARTSTWEEGKMFYQGVIGEPYMDICVSSNKWFRCKRTHISSNDNKPIEGTETAYWQPANNFNFIATDLLLADIGIVDLLYSQKILMRNSADVLTASLNADGNGSYVIYYPSGRKRMEFSYEGFIRYYNDNNGNTKAWELGAAGNIVKPQADTYPPMKLASLGSREYLENLALTYSGNPTRNATLRAQSPIYIDSGTEFTRTQYYMYNWGGGSAGYEGYNGRIYTTSNPSNMDNSIINDGWYTPNERSYQIKKQDGTTAYAITTYRIINGYITHTFEVTQY